MDFLIRIPAAAWLLLSAIFFAAGEYSSKKWALDPSWGRALQVVALYGICALAWLPALLHKNQLSIMGIAWLVLATVATVIIGVFVFHESLSITHSLGVGLGLAALVLMSM